MVALGDSGFWEDMVIFYNKDTRKMVSERRGKFDDFDVDNCERDKSFGVI